MSTKKEKLKELTELKIEFLDTLDQLKLITHDAHNILDVPIEDNVAGQYIWEYLMGMGSQRELIKNLNKSP